VSYFSQGLAVVQIEDKYGYINQKGEVMISPIYNWAESFTSYEYAAAKVEERAGFIDRDGNIAIPFDYSKTYSNAGNALLAMDEEIYAFAEWGNGASLHDAHIIFDETGNPYEYNVRGQFGDSGNIVLLYEDCYGILNNTH
jgi:hypothetical protein